MAIYLISTQIYIYGNKKVLKMQRSPKKNTGAKENWLDFLEPKMPPPGFWDEDIRKKPPKYRISRDIKRSSKLIDICYIGNICFSFLGYPGYFWDIFGIYFYLRIKYYYIIYKKWWFIVVPVVDLLIT